MPHNVDELTKIREIFGELTAKTTVEAARDEKSRLHNYFEWDNSIAGEKYREQQARTLIGCVIERPDLAQPERRVFLVAKLPDADTPQYYPTEIVLQNVDLWNDAMRRLKSHIDGAMAEFQHLTAHAPQAKKNDLKRAISKAAQLSEAVSSL